MLPEMDRKSTDHICHSVENLFHAFTPADNLLNNMSSCSVKPIKITILGDSVTKHVNTESFSKELGASVHNESNIYISIQHPPCCPQLILIFYCSYIYIGTNHIKQELVGQTIQRRKTHEK